MISGGATNGAGCSAAETLEASPAALTAVSSPRRPPLPAKPGSPPEQLALDVGPPPVHPPDFRPGEKAVYGAFPSGYGKP